MRLCDLIIQGKTIADAAIIRGVSESSIYRWLSKGKKPGAEPIFVELVERVQEAVECSEIELLQDLRIASQEPKNWRAIAWMLERRWPDKWGQRDLNDTSHQCAPTVDNIVTPLSTIAN
jgi:transposase